MLRSGQSGVFEITQHASSAKTFALDHSGTSGLGPSLCLLRSRRSAHSRTSSIRPERLPTAIRCDDDRSRIFPRHQDRRERVVELAHWTIGYRRAYLKTELTRVGILVVGANNLSGSSSGDGLAITFDKDSGAITAQKSISRVTAQYAGYACIDSNGYPRVPVVEYNGANPNMACAVLNTDLTLNYYEKTTETITRLRATAPDTDGSIFLSARYAGTLGYIAHFNSSGVLDLDKQLANFIDMSSIVINGSEVVVIGQTFYFGQVYPLIFSLNKALTTVNWAKRLDRRYRRKR